MTGSVVSFQAARPDPWRDELATWSVARRPVSEIFELGHHIDGVTVPYYLLAHFSTLLFGDSLLALRLPSLLAMTATSAVAALLARRLWGPLPGLLAGLLLAVLPVISRYAQEARGYAPAAFFATLATLLLLMAVEKGRWGLWTAYAISIALLGLSHQIALLLLIGHLAIVAVRNWRLLAWWGPGVALALAALLPFALRGLGQRGHQLDWLAPATPDDLSKIIDNVFNSGILGGAICVLAALAARDRQGALLLLTAAAPIPALYAADHLLSPMFVNRYLLFVIPLLCVLAARSLATLRLPAALAVVLVLGLIGLPKQEEFRKRHSPYDYRAAAAVIRDGALPGDSILFAQRQGWVFTETGFEYYLGDDGPDDVLRTATAEQNDSLWPTECPDPAPCFSTVYRIWTLSPDNVANGARASSTDQLTNAQRAILTGAFDQTMLTRVDGFTIGLFTRRL
ncbi:glycosyltransferase family 39 protein [Actinoplanes sp. NPDC051494]|uniref:glycosyltransferase family 39 protein n=1 Tax=Actinoplanes sp. NPDC051494 TaxID=3363907 RepID=UPI0037A786D6